MRFGVSLGAIFAFGITLLVIALFSGESTGGLRIGAGVIGACMISLAMRVMRRGRTGISLNQAGLFETTGREICRIEDIRTIDRGFAALRPSTGFMIRLHEAADPGWSPGLWWRYGRMVGIGGMTPPGQGRAMAEILSAMLADREHRPEAKDP